MHDHALGLTALTYGDVLFPTSTTNVRETSEEGRGGEGRGGRGGCKGRDILPVGALKHAVWLTRPLSRIKRNHDPGSVSDES